MFDNTINKIIDAIKSDNLVLFSEYIKGNENLSFGRFPVLSLAYLYSANKITKSFKFSLGCINKYKQVDEDFEFFKKLKSVAGKKIRLFVNGNIISPLEMLALMGRTGELKKCYSKFYTNEEINANIMQIFQITSQKSEIRNSEIYISKRPMSNYQKKSLIASTVVSCFMATLLAVVYVIFGVISGFGYGQSYFKISTAKSLMRALNSSSSYVLTKDIIIDDETKDMTFDGVLDGNGHTIYVSNLQSGLISKSSGVIKNLNVVYTLSNREETEELSLLVEENSGTIFNVNINVECDDLKFIKGENDVGIYGFCVDNDGTIMDSKIYINLNILTSMNGECSVGGFVKNNSGLINNCEVLEGSKIEANNCDISGIALNNNFGGEISFCENNAELKQSSDAVGWSPNVSGICQLNNGTIGSCTNYGELKIVSNSNGSEEVGIVYIGGVVARNNGLIDNCLSAGDINTLSHGLYIYAGGITAYSYYTSDDNKNTYISRIYNCGVKGNISLECVGDKALVLAGGISGFAWGEIDKSFSSASFSQGFTKEKYYIGLAVGVMESVTYFMSTQVYLKATDCYVLSTNNVERQIGANVEGNVIKNAGFDYLVSDISNGINTVLTLDDLKDCEVYYDR